MKAEIKATNFNPIKIELTIESEEELRQLFARLSFEHNFVEKNTTINILSEDKTDALYKTLKLKYDNL
jgi:hypothetical protein